MLLLPHILFFRSTASPILGGNSVDSQTKFPFTVSLREGNTPDTHFCGGSIISKSLILTAAHCTQGRNIKDLRVAVNAYNFDKESAVSFYSVIRVFDAGFVAPSNSSGPFFLENDMAILQLKNEIVGEFQRVQLSSEFIDGGKTVYAVGWGITEDLTAPGDQLAARILQEITLPAVSADRCNMLYKNLTNSKGASMFPRGLSPDVFCAGGEIGKDTCTMDSGGPVFIKSNGSFQQVGIVSGSGSRICGTRLPSFFTRSNITKLMKDHELKLKK